MNETMTKGAGELADVLRTDSGVDAGYAHGPKQATPGAAFQHKGTVLKWYALHPQDRPVPGEIGELARSYLSRNKLEAKGLGFVILHRCGKDFYFLIVNTWRNNNELWETVFYKNGEAMDDFALWPRDSVHKPTFCVWELVPVWHEKESWERFLKSSRDEAAARSWLEDCYTGPA